MELDTEWFMNYIRLNVTRIVVPSKAKRIGGISEAMDKLKEELNEEKIKKLEEGIDLKQDDKYIYVTFEGYDKIKEIKRKFLIIYDKKSMEEIYDGEIGVSSSIGNEKFSLVFDDIWKCDLEKIKKIPFNVQIELASDFYEKDAIFQENITNDDYMKYYTVDEVSQIQRILKDIIVKVNVPPKEIKNREKIIFVQIVKELANQEVLYDKDVAKIITEQLKEQDNQVCANCDSEIEKRIADSQTLKGLLNNQTVCAGFSRIVQAICLYFGIKCSLLVNAEHSWNLVELDGGQYEDDFTWYLNDLKISNIFAIKTFLNGINGEGKREISKTKSHEIEEQDIELSQGLPKVQIFNLLSTDWSKISDWEGVDLDEDKLPKIISFIEQIKGVVNNNDNILKIAKRKIDGKIGRGLSNFISKIKNIVHIKDSGKSER